MEASDRLNRRFSVLGDLRSVTGTMRALSAVNIRHFENAAKAISEHDSVLDLGFHALRINWNATFGATRSNKRPPANLVMIFGSDHGLCGRFNERVIDHARSHVFETQDGTSTSLASLLGDSGKTAPTRLLVIGHIAAQICDSTGLTAYSTYPLPGIVDSIPELVRNLILQIDSWVLEQDETSIDVFHHMAVPGSGIDIKHMAILPLGRLDTIRKRRWPTRNLPGITLSTETLFAALVREHIFTGLYRACAESQAAEHISRLASMQAACRNIDEQIDTVGRALRKHRQAAVTSELLDTVAGYESIVQD